jgi:Tol biopolymer transport system component
MMGEEAVNVQGPGNPYSADRPAVDEAQFFGREKELERVTEVLGGTGVRRVVVVQGSFRIGKTSFLHALRRRLVQRVFVIDLSGAEDERPGYLLWRSATTIATELQNQTGRPFPKPEVNDFLADSSFFHVVFLPTVYKAIKRRRLVLAFDGLDAPRGSDGRPREAFFAYLGSLMESSLNLSLIVTTEEWSEQGSSLFENAYRLVLGPLSEAEATELVVESARDTLQFDYQAARRILELSSGHPYFVQLLCHAIFERHAVEGRVSEKDVEAVIDGVLDVASPYMERMWNGTSSRARTVLAALATLRGVRGIFLEQDLAYALRRRGTVLPPTEIREACEELVEKDVLEALGAMSYRFKVALVLMWLVGRREVKSLLEISGTRRVASSAGDWIGRFLWPLIGLLALTAAVLACLLWWPPIRDHGQSAATPEQTEAISSLSYTQVTATPSSGFVPSPLPTPRSPTLDIAYMAWDEHSGSWDIYAMSRDGSLVKQLTNSDADDSSPVWAPDHTWLAFVSKRDGNQEIYRMNADGSEATNLTRNAAADWTPSISPDGTKIVFSSLRDGNWELYLMDADGSQPARMTFNEEPDYAPAWSPDSSKIAFVSERDGNLEIYVMDADGTDESRLTFNDALDLAPAWSPDGSLIAFESYRDGNMEIYVMNADGSEQRNLTNYPLADDHGPSWSDDGLALLFYSNRDGNWDLYLMNPQGGDARNLTNSPGQEQEPYWSS